MTKENMMYISKEQAQKEYDECIFECNSEYFTFDIDICKRNCQKRLDWNNEKIEKVKEANEEFLKKQRIIKEYSLTRKEIISLEFTKDELRTIISCINYDDLYGLDLDYNQITFINDLIKKKL